jgi:hypothetical protein
MKNNSLPLVPKQELGNETTRLVPGNEERSKKIGKDIS